MITAESLHARLAPLEEIGLGERGVSRLAWTPEDAACRAWFRRQAQALRLIVATDPAGNLWACPSVQPPWWAAGSHLDSVREGGRFDGPLGLACAFEIAAERPIAVLAFADEEGARFNTPTFGSRALAGRLDLPKVFERRDERGVTLREALGATGVHPAEVGTAPSWLPRLAGFIEVHIDQSTAIARAGAPVGLAGALVTRLRLEVELRGRADHAGATPRGERRDALAAAARLMVAADELAEGGDRLIVTTSRIVAHPNAPTTIARRVGLWIDARAPVASEVEQWLRALRQFAEELASRTRVEIALRTASRSDGRELSPQLRVRLARAGETVAGRPVPEIVCFAGHDAGVLAEHIPSAVVLVRNRSGVSHAPEESVDLADAATAANVVVAALG